MTVATVLRSGGHYTAEWVERLSAQCERYLPPHDFVCLTDMPVDCPTIALREGWPGWWSKLELWRDDILPGRVVYFDLDTLMVDKSAGALFGYTGRFAALTDFLRADIFATGVMAWDGDQTAGLWERIQRDPPGFRGRSDLYLNPLVAGADRLQTLFPGLIGSYKVDRLAAGPGDYGVVCFHGRPRISELANWARNHWEA